MTEQEIVNRIAKAAKPRLLDLLKLRAKHVYVVSPGAAKSKIAIAGHQVEFKSVKSTQPYKSIERFLAKDAIIGFVVNPGLLPIVKAITMDIRGRDTLVTRMLQASDKDKGVVAHLEDFGLRINLFYDAVQDETHVVWECLYGVL